MLIITGTDDKVIAEVDISDNVANVIYCSILPIIEQNLQDKQELEHFKLWFDMFKSIDIDNLPSSVFVKVCNIIKKLALTSHELIPYKNEIIEKIDADPRFSN